MHDLLVIMAGGMSSRMKRAAENQAVLAEDAAQADTVDKGMIGVGSSGRPLMDYLLLNAREAGYKRIIIVTGTQSLEMHEQYGKLERDNPFHGLSISYAIQSIPPDRVKPLGTADAIYQAMVRYPELQERAFTCCNSDNLYSTKALKQLRKTDAPNAWINYDRNGLDFSEEKIRGFALTLVDSHGYLEGVVEKPDEADIPNYVDPSGSLRVSMNIFKLTGSLVTPFIRDCPLSDRNEKELPGAILSMAKKLPRTVLGIPLNEHVPDLTDKSDIAKVREYLSQHYGELNW
jgi:NDP-sugar pyrophosphorylase family protein